MTRLNIRIEKELAKIDEPKYNYTEITEPVLAIKKMLENGCDVDGQDANGDTLLHIVLKHGKIRCHNTVREGEYGAIQDVLDINYLLTRHKPNPFIKNKDGLTPSMLASRLKLTAEWQLLSSYEQAYMAEHTGRVLQGLFTLANLNLQTKILTPNGKSATKDVYRSIVKLQGSRQKND